MNLRITQLGVTAALLAALTPAVAQQQKSAPPASKPALERRAAVLTSQIEQLRAQGASRKEIASLKQELQSLTSDARFAAARQSGGASSSPSATPSSGAQQLAAPTCGNAPLTTLNFAGTTGPITPPITSAATFTTTVSGLGTVLWDVNLNAAISHTYNSDLEITLTSPAGTTVTVSTGNAGGNDDVFNGTTWDDNVNDPTTDHTYTNLVAAPLLSPEGRFAGFRGEDPNGTWTLTIFDNATFDVGTLNSWSLDITTVAALPATSTTTLTQSPGLAISAVGTPTVVDTQIAGGLPTSLTDVKLYVEITHSWCDDLDIRLTSPAGTTVTVTTDNGGFALFDVYNGSLFDVDSQNTTTDAFYVDFTAMPLMSPEGSFDNFLGQDPNGTWTLTIFDDTGGDGGTLVRWDVALTSTATPATPSAPANFVGTTGAIPDFAPPTVVPTVYTTSVSGSGPYLFDVDLTTFIEDTFPGDLTVTLQSPAGTTVTVSSQNVGDADNVFNGTLWDDNANDPVTTHTYTDNVVASPLSPEGRFSAFRGENPNGVWTMTISDADALDNGNVSSWSIDVSTLTGAPGEALTTVTQSPALAILDVATVSDVMAVSGAGTSLVGMTLYVEIQHTYNADLEVTLTSPAGTIVPVTVNNGDFYADVYNGTLFDPAVLDTVTDHVYIDLVAATPLSPEGAFDNFLAQDPNGNWTLTITDGAGGDVGTLVRWDLNLRTCVGAGSAFCSNGTLGLDHTTGCPCGNTGAPGNGCGHSFDANGANMEASGSISADTVVLHSQFEPVSSFTLMMQHANAGDSIFHDGVLCASNPLIRLRGRSAVAGEAFFPNSNFANDSTTTLSIRGGTFPGSGATMRYAAWYRNASSTFCPPATANVTNGWQITW
jgi:subtilisin-like proprotein convertase family protein